MIDKTEEFHFDPNAPKNNGDAQLQIAIPFLQKVIGENINNPGRVKFTQELADAFTNEELIAVLQSLDALGETIQIIQTIVALRGLRSAVKQQRAEATTEPVTA